MILVEENVNTPSPLPIYVHETWIHQNGVSVKIQEHKLQLQLPVQPTISQQI